MAQVTTLVCDKCNQAPAHTWMIIGPTNQTWAIDLCDDCRNGKLDPILTVGRVAAHPTKPASKFRKEAVKPI